MKKNFFLRIKIKAKCLFTAIIEVFNLEDHRSVRDKFKDSFHQSPIPTPPNFEEYERYMELRRPNTPANLNNGRNSQAWS